MPDDDPIRQPGTRPDPPDLRTEVRSGAKPIGSLAVLTGALSALALQFSAEAIGVRILGALLLPLLFGVIGVVAGGLLGVAAFMVSKRTWRHAEPAPSYSVQLDEARRRYLYEPFAKPALLFLLGVIATLYSFWLGGDLPSLLGGEMATQPTSAVVGYTIGAAATVYAIKAAADAMQENIERSTEGTRTRLRELVRDERAPTDDEPHE